MRSANRSMAVGLFLLATALTLPAAVDTDVRSYVENHLELGTRITLAMLQDAKQHYLGTINELEVDEDYLPLGLFIDWYFTPYVGVGWTRDDLTLSTVTDPDGGTDGDFELTSNILSLIGRYPNEGRYTPYGGIGLAFFSTSFEPTSSWGSRNGGQTFNTDDPVTLTFHAGCTIKVADRWFADVCLRYVPLEVEVEHSIAAEGKPRDPLDFPMDHIVLGVGMRYGF